MYVSELRKTVFLSKILIIISVFLSVFFSIKSQAARKISFQTKIIKPDGNNLEASAVNFKFSLTDPSGTCVLYSEIFSNVDMSSSSGSLTLLLGEGSRSYPTTGGVNWTSAFDNKTTSYNCAPPSSTTYSPSVGDSRKLYVQFNDGSPAGSQLLPAMEVSAVPYAMYADNATTLGSYASTDFILKANATTCTGGQVSSYDGTTFNCVAAGGAGSGGASGYNFVNTTSNGATNITAQPNGTATSSGVAVYNSSSGVNNAYGSILAGVSAVDIRSGVNGTGTQLPLTFTVGSSEAMRFDTSGNMGVGTNTPSSKLDVSGALTMRGMAAPSLSGAGQGRIYFDSVANKFKVSENGGAYVDLLGAGSSAYVDGGNSYGAAATLGTNDNYALNFETNNTTRMTIDNAGKVGIGTVSPTSFLHIVGSDYGAGAGNASPALTVQGGSGGAANGDGGGISLTGGSATVFTASSGGNISITGGAGPKGGTVTLAGGMNLAGGSGDATGGSIALTGGDLGSIAGAVSIIAGDGGNGSHPGGDVNIAAGNGASGNQSGGSVVIDGGAKTGSGTNGNVLIATNRGNVGIGTTSPLDKLSIVSDGASVVSIKNTSATGFSSLNTFDSAGTLVGGVGYGNSGTIAPWVSNYYLASVGTVPLVLVTQNTERLRVTPVGSVGINTTTPGSALDVKGTLRLSGATSGYVGFAPAAAAGSTTYTLPSADGTASQVLTTNGSGVLSWSTPSGGVTSVGGTLPISSSGGATPTISIAQSNTTTDGYLSSTDWNTFNNKLGTATSFSGDVSGAYNSTSVDKIKGKTVSPAAYSTGQVLRYNGTDWVNTALGFSDLSGKPTTLAGYGITDAQSSTLASGKLLVGNGSNVATAVSMSGDATMDNAGAITLATVPVSKGGTNVTSFTANKIVGTNGTGTALTSFSCALNEVITFDVTGVAVCNNVAAVSGAFVDAGNSYGAAATLGTNDNYALNFETNNTTRMTIDNAGNVGVGTSSPGAKLHISESANIANEVRLTTSVTADNIISFSVVNDAYLQTQIKSQVTNWSGNGASDLLFLTKSSPFGGGPTEIVRFAAGGNVGIGTASPGFTLEVNGTIAPTGNGATDLGASGNKFRDVYATNGTINTSDFRQKRNIQSSDLGLSFINELRPVSYNWKDGDSHVHYGVIAQEAKNAIKEAKKLSGRLDEVDNVIVTHDEATDAYGVRYTELISPIIKAIQELYSQLIGVNAKVSKLEIENAQLKKENEAIKDRLEKIEKALLNNKK